MGAYTSTPAVSVLTKEDITKALQSPELSSNDEFWKTFWFQPVPSEGDELFKPRAARDIARSMPENLGILMDQVIP